MSTAVDDAEIRAVEHSDRVWFNTDPLPDPTREAVDAVDLPAIVDAVVERCVATVFTSHAEDTAFVDLLRASVSENVHAVRDVISGRASLDDIHLERVLAFAGVQAQLRIPQKSMQRSYRVSFFIQWEMWTDHMRRELAIESLPCDEATEIMTQLTRIILSYQDFVASRVAETYTRDYDALSRSRVHIRKGLVREVLRGEHASLTASDLAILGYPLDAQHVAILLPSMAEGAATQLADGLRSASFAHQTLLYPLTLTSTAIWLCRYEPWRPELLEDVVSLLQHVGAEASVSDVSVGVDGFRRSFQQTEDTERVRAGWGSADAPLVIKYADAGLEILLLQDIDLARAFVESELGPLAASTPEAERLRETLSASFRFCSHVAAAQHLQLHEHTVRNRLHRAEEILGRPLQERRTELQVAIRLVRLLGDDD